MLTLIDVNFPSSIDLIHDTCYLCTRKDFDFSNGVWLNSEKKNILQIDFEVKKILQGNTRHSMALYVREKKILSPEV